MHFDNPSGALRALFRYAPAMVLEPITLMPQRFFPFFRKQVRLLRGFQVAQASADTNQAGGALAAFP